MSITRRRAIASGAAAIATTAFPLSATGAAAPHRRYNMASANGQKMIERYAEAVRVMLKRDPTDPFNWYRYTLIHTLDCPHGNWWFLPWHRAYTGYFEQICRVVLKDDSFTLPYWDWTAVQEVPAVMFKDVLTPTASEFIESYDKFADAYGPILDSWFAKMSDDQRGQLGIRCYREYQDVLYDIEHGPMFFPRPKARGLTPQNPKFDGYTTFSTSLPKLLDALSPRDFMTFGSLPTRFHSSLTGFGVLEAFPHNKVHNCVGGIVYNDDGSVKSVGDGFMQSNMSPVDPIFFMHHSNIDRVWDLWTRKQQGYGYPTLPPSDLLTQWRSEKLLFFTDAQGTNLPHTAGEFETIGNFAYDYEPASGEEIVPKKPGVKQNVKPKLQTFPALIADANLNAPNGASAKVALATPPADTPLFATITLDLPPHSHAEGFKVLVNGDGNGNPGSPGFAEMFTMFGNHAMTHPIKLVVPISRPLGATLSKAGTQTISVVQAGAQSANLMAMPGMTQAAPVAKVLSVEVSSD